MSCVTPYHPVYCTLPTVGSKRLFSCSAHTSLLRSHVTLYRSTVTFIHEIRTGERKDEENKNSEKGFRVLNSRGFIFVVDVVVCIFITAQDVSEHSLSSCYIWQTQYKHYARNNMLTTCMIQLLRYLHYYIYMYGVVHSVCQLWWIDRSLVNICEAERTGISLLYWLCFR